MVDHAAVQLLRHGAVVVAPVARFQREPRECPPAWRPARRVRCSYPLEPANGLGERHGKSVRNSARIIPTCSAKPPRVSSRVVRCP